MPLLKHKDNRVRGNAILLVYSQDPTKALSELANMAASKKLWMRSSTLYCIKTLNFDEKEQYLAQMLYDESDDSIINEILAWMKFVVLRYCCSFKSKNRIFIKRFKVIA